MHGTPGAAVYEDLRRHDNIAAKLIFCTDG